MARRKRSRVTVGAVIPWDSMMELLGPYEDSAFELAEGWHRLEDQLQGARATDSCARELLAILERAAERVQRILRALRDAGWT